MKYFQVIRRRKDVSFPLFFFWAIFLYYVITEDQRPVLLMSTYFIGFLTCKINFLVKEST